MNINELFENGYTGNIAVTGDIVTVKGAKETIQFNKGETTKHETGYDQVEAVPAFSYKTAAGKITKTEITTADLSKIN
jgi:hypothetical protein